MAGINRVTLIGRLGKDPEIRYLPSGAASCTFTLATSESWDDKQGQRQEKTEWHKIITWNKIAELCGQYLAKGRLVYLEGKLQTRSYDDRDGKKTYTTEIVAQTVQFLGSRDDQQSGQVKQHDSEDMGYGLERAPSELPPAQAAAPTYRPSPDLGPKPTGRAYPEPPTQGGSSRRPQGPYEPGSDDTDDLPFHHLPRVHKLMTEL